jgi:hypothetical protein
VATVEGAPGNFGTLDGVLVHGNRGALSALADSGQQIGPWQGSGRRVSFTACAMPQTGNSAANYAAANSGSYDATWNAMFAGLIAAGYSNCILRPFHEFNASYSGEWNVTDSGGTSAANFKSAFQRFVGLARAASAGFLIDFCWISGGSVDIPTYDPGAAYYDIVGLDDYGRNPGSLPAFPSMQSVAYGLNDHTTLATARGKPMSFPEWSQSVIYVGFPTVTTGDDPGDTTSMVNWIKGHNVYYHTPYFDDNGAIDTDLSYMPLTLAALHAGFGR